MAENKNLIEIKNFCVNYKKKQVLNQLNFAIKQKECFTILGESGAGKTTLLKCIIGLKRPSSGDILVEGQSVISKSEEELVEVRKKIAYVFQNGALFDSMTVFENLALPLQEHKKLSYNAIKNRVRSQLEDFELKHTEHLYPSELSGGMQKRVGIARCMMLKPKVILYDEPTVSLDPYNTANLVKIMLKLKKKGTTSILVTHNIPVAMKISDRIALLSGGRIEATGTPKTIEKDYNVLLKNFMQGLKGGTP